MDGLRYRLLLAVEEGDDDVSTSGREATGKEQIIEALCIPRRNGGGAVSICADSTTGGQNIIAIMELI